jgi:outer membrane lipoprotein-sorting protein
MLSLCLKAQYAGYTLMTDLTAFKQQFAVTAQKTTSIKSDFIQEKNLGMLSEKIISKGKFWYKKDNLLRMEYIQPFKYLMVINKDKVYMKDGQKENSISTRSNKLFQQINKIMIDCVKGAVFNNPDFSIRIFQNNNGYLVELSPIAKNLKTYFKNINIIIDKKDYSASKIEMNEPSGDNTIISFVNREINTPIADALFNIR